MKTTARETGGSGQLVDYIEKEQVEEHEIRSELRDSIGRELSDEEIEEFIEQSEKDGFSRQVVLSTAPDNDLSESEMREKTERVLNDYIEDKPSAHYVYGVHEDTDQIHSHAAVRGDRRDLYMDTEEMSDFKVRSEREFQGPERARELADDLEMELSEERERELGLEQSGDFRDRADGLDRDRAGGLDREISDDDLEIEIDGSLDLGGDEHEQTPEPEQEPEPERDQGLGIER